MAVPTLQKLINKILIIKLNSCQNIYGILT